MTDYFFTLGGGQFWEDLRVENHWRIQRNVSSKSCRLLDNHDIIRAKGNFDDCAKGLDNYHKAYDLPKIGKHLIICLHSFARTRKIFDDLIKIADRKKLNMEAIDYPSMQRGLKEQVEQINTLISNLADKIDSISFITYGSGNVVLEKLLAGKNDWQKRVKLGRAVEIAPMISENSLLSKLTKLRIGSFVLGPMAKELQKENFDKWHKQPDIDVGAIVIPKKDSALKAKEFCGAKIVLEMPISSWHPFSDKNLSESVLNFIQSGHF